MKFTESMLRDYVQSSLSAEAIADLLTMTGFELEEITEVEGEKVLDINIMANRGDGASVLGMAREVLAKDSSAKPTDLYLRATERFPASDAGNRDVWAKTSVAVETPNCTRYACRVFEGLSNGDAPAWIQERLRKVGQRPISLLVDLTNYVMLETGQPLHAFDLDKLAGERIVVRQAEKGEKLTTLDGTEHELQPSQMMICDASRPVAVAGVMGGEDTEVSATTTRCLLESAHFVNTSVRATRKALGLFTEASYRFERHVDPEGVVAALNRFAELLYEATGNRPIGGVLDVYPIKPELSTLKVRVSKASALLGMPVSFDEAREALKRLGYVISGQDGETLTIVPPTWRIDIQREEDLVEEIGRVVGYEKIPEALPIGSTPLGGAHGFELLVDTVREQLLRSGLDQTISHSLRDVHPLDAPTERVMVRNPHAPEMAYLRNSMLPSLCDAAIRNGGNNLHLFEIGRAHAAGSEETLLGILSVGAFEGPGWSPRDTTVADFFSLKGIVEAVARAVRISLELKRGTMDPRFHPTRQARVFLGGVEVGVFGQIHPERADETDLPPSAVLGEVNLSQVPLRQDAQINLRSVSRNPAARRDIAILIDKKVPYSELEAAIVSAGGSELEKHWLFDIYDGQGVPDGQHSLAIALQFRKVGSNFTDEEANALRDQIIGALTALGGKLR